MALRGAAYIRPIPLWDGVIAPAMAAGQRVLVVAHGNSLRALFKHLDAISDEDIVELNIPTGIPLVYELQDNLAPVRRFYMSEPGVQTLDATPLQLPEHLA